MRVTLVFFTVSAYNGVRTVPFLHRLGICREDPGIALEDGAVKIILNTRGSVGDISDGLRRLLRYMDGLAPESDYTRKLDRAVAEVRADENWRREYMVLMERDREKMRLGERRRSVASVRTFRNDFQPDQLARISFVSPALLQTILDTIDAHPDWDDEQVAENVDFE